MATQESGETSVGIEYLVQAQKRRMAALQEENTMLEALALQLTQQVRTLLEERESTKAVIDSLTALKEESDGEAPNAAA